MKKFTKFWIWVLLSALIFLGIVGMGGCHGGASGGIRDWFGGGSSQNSQSSTKPPRTGIGDGIKINTLFSLFMIATVGGIIVGLSGLKVGWLVAMGNIGGIVLSLTIAQYGKFLALGGLIAAVITVVAMLLRNRQFQVQSVKAVQQLKSELPEYKEKINEVFWQNQNRTTEKIVQNIKQIFKKKEVKAAVVAKEILRKELKNGIGVEKED